MCEQQDRQECGRSGLHSHLQFPLHISQSNYLTVAQSPAHSSIGIASRLSWSKWASHWNPTPDSEVAPSAIGRYMAAIQSTSSLRHATPSLGREWRPRFDEG